MRRSNSVGFVGSFLVAVIILKLGGKQKGISLDGI
jgi:hypothetical protein